MFLTKLLKMLIFTLALCAYIVGVSGESRTGKAHWNDDNIVLVNGQWTYVPDDTWGTPHAPYDDRWKSPKSTIIVLVAALRESRLPQTILSAFDNAKYPDRIRFGVVQQNDPSDPDCMEEVCKERGRPLVRLANGTFANPLGCEEFDKVRVLRMLASEAAGPVYARGHQPQVLEDEDFCMQIDAHTIFKKDWDVLMLGEWSKTENEFAVLSTYPTNYKDLDKNSNHHWEMPHICGVQMSNAGAISNKQASAAANLNRPLLAPLWAAGLSFSRCHAERNVPNDVHLKQIFSGEEFSRAARLWTHGYDFYSITRPTIGVYYGSEKGGRGGGWRSNREETKKSLSRLQTLLKYPDSDQSAEAIAALGKFALGTKRTLEQYAEFSGVNPMTNIARDKCIVKYVPWDDSGMREMIYKQEQDLRDHFRPRHIHSNDHDDENRNNDDGDLAKQGTRKQAGSSDTQSFHFDRFDALRKNLRTEADMLENGETLGVFIALVGFGMTLFFLFKMFHCSRFVFGKGRKHS